MSWQTWILGQTVLSAFATLVTRILARDKRTANAGIAIPAVSMSIIYLCGLVAVPWLGHINPGVIDHYGWRFLGGGLAFALSNIFAYYLFKYLDASVGSILGSMNAIFAVIGASVFLHEELTDLQIVGASFLLMSIIYGSLATRHLKNATSHRNLLLGAAAAIATSVFYAIAMVNEKWLLGKMGIGDYVVFGWGGQLIVALAVAIILQPKAFRLMKYRKTALLVGGLGLFRGVSGVAMVESEVKSNNVGLMSVISNFRLIVIVLLGIWLLRERQKIPQKLLASAAAVVALTLMFWQK